LKRWRKRVRKKKTQGKQRVRPKRGDESALLGCRRALREEFTADYRHRCSMLSLRPLCSMPRSPP